MIRTLLTIAAMLFAANVQAQGTALSSSGNSSSSVSMAELIQQGYEIKTAVSNGSKLIVFMQKDNSAYACEFASLTNSRCGSIN